MPNIYKTFTKSDLDNRQHLPISNERQTEVDSILTKFVELFKAKHLG